MARRRIIKNAKQFNQRAEAYFAECEANGSPILLTGLILALGLSSRQSLDRYADIEEFSDPVKRAKLRVEQEYERRLLSTSPTGAIFALKNFGWRDQQNVEHSGPNGGPIEHKRDWDLSELSKEELIALENTLLKIEEAGSK